VTFGSQGSIVVCRCLSFAMLTSVLCCCLAGLNLLAKLLVKLQVELMMKFDHPNLIKAYHYVTWGASGVSVRLTRVRLHT
jgi:hypothetical protein